MVAFLMDGSEVGFPTEHDFLVPQDKGTNGTSFFGTTEQAQILPSDELGF